jgi:hypothetical protein
MGDILTSSATSDAWAHTAAVGQAMSGSIGLLAIALFLLIAGGQNCLAEPNKLQYEKEERCGSQARGIFEKDWKGNGIVNTEDGQIVATFENHYNPTLNK